MDTIDTKAIATDGTTLVSLVYDGGVTLGCDGRSSSAILIGHRMSDKLEPLHQYIYCQRTGVSAHTETVAKYARYFIDAHVAETGELPLVDTAASIVQSIFYNNRKYLRGSMLVGGWDPVEGPQLFDCNHGAKIPKKLAWNGSGSYVILGYMDKNFKENMSKAEAFEFIKEAISLATFRDSSSGGSIRIVDITKDGKERHYISQNDKIIK